MVGEVETPLKGLKMSSVVPATVTGENAVHQLSNLDLALKLHYLRTLYYFEKEAFQGLGILDLRQPMFRWLDHFCSVAGRIRRSPDTGRPFIKCNDSGVRVLEGRIDETLDEWLAKKDWSLHSHLVPAQVLGPEMLFSPLAVVQFTWFRCGGVAMGFSWSHVLGDVFSARNFLKLWIRFMAGSPHSPSIRTPRSTFEKPIKTAQPPSSKPLPAKQVAAVGDHWLAANDRELETFPLYVSPFQLKLIQSKISTQLPPPFEALSAVIWRSLAKIRKGRETKTVTICRNDADGKEDAWLSQGQTLSTVKADFGVESAELSQLAALIEHGRTDESKEIEKMVEGDDGSPDLIVYGANLTFVDLQEVDFYGLEMKGHKPKLVQFKIDGVGDEGAVLVLRGKEEEDGWTVMVTLPEEEAVQLKSELESEWGIAI